MSDIVDGEASARIPPIINDDITWNDQEVAVVIKGSDPADNTVTTKLCSLDANGFRIEEQFWNLE